MAIPERHRKNNPTEKNGNSNTSLNDLPTRELIKKTVRHTAEYLKLQLELRRARREQGLHAYSSQPETAEIKSFILNPEDATFFSDYNRVAGLLFSLPEIAERTAPGVVGIFGAHPLKGQQEKQIGIIKHVPGQLEQDIVVLNNGVVMLIGPNNDKEVESSDAYRRRIRPTIAPDITYQKDNKITDESVSAIKVMFDFTMNAQVLLTSESPEGMDRLYPLIVQTFVPQSTFITDLDEAVHAQRVEETVAREAGSAVQTAEMFVWDAELDRINTSRKSNVEEPPAQAAA